jgi:DNA-binding transcriptional MerR regulator
MSDRRHWIQRWREAGVSERIIREFYTRYGEPEEAITRLIEQDDKRAGIGPIKLNTNRAIADHDIEHLLHKLNYPVSTNAETQWRFFRRQMTSAAKGAVAVIRDPIWAIIGAGAGAAIWVVREILL